ncbi:MAG: hypothetical protein HOV97_05970 [Nonomuraea sp.]|nr:hypothetical protein [Nonomuraea sp.]
MKGESLEEFVARVSNSSATDPTWRTDYSTQCEQAGVHLSGTGHSQTECPTLGGDE